MTDIIKHHRETDLCGMCCAQPILRLTKEFSTMQSGEVLLAVADKSSLAKDIPAYCAQTGHQLINQENDRDVYRFWIRRT